MSTNEFPGRSFLEQIVDEFTEGVLVADDGGEIIHVTDSVAELLGQSATEMIGQSAEAVLSTAGIQLPTDDSNRQAKRECVHDVTDAVAADTDRRLFLSVSEITDEGAKRTVLGFEQPRRRVQNRPPLESSRVSTNDPSMLVDPVEDVIIDCNRQLCDLLEYDREELRSLEPSEIYRTEQQQFQSFVDELLQTTGRKTGHFSIETGNGGTVPVDISASVVTIDGLPYVLATVHDVSDHAQYEHKLEALNKATREMMRAETVSDVAAVTLDIIDRIIDQQHTILWRFDEADRRLYPVEMSESVAALATRGETENSLVIEADSVEMEAFRTGESTFLQEYQTCEDAAHPHLGLQSRFLVPLGDYGLLAVGALESGQLTSSTRELVQLVAGNTQTVLDRLASERKLRRHSVAMEAASDGIAILDEDTQFRYANAAYADIFGYESAGELRDIGWRELLDDRSMERMEEDVLPAVRNSGTWQGTLVGVRSDGLTIDLSVAITQLEDGGYVNVCSDISEQKTQERRLTSLNEMNQALMQAESWESIADIGIKTVVDCTPHDIVAMRKFEPEGNTLEIEVMTDSAASLLDSQPAYDLESTYAGTAYRQGEPVVKETDAADDYVSFSSLHVPLRSYGTLSILAEEQGAFSENLVEFVRLLGIGLGIALERAERDTELRDRQKELTRLNEVNTVVREIIQSLVEAVSREQIETTICEQLADSELYTYAWIGDVDEEAERIVPRASAGIELDILRAMAGMDLFEAGVDTVIDAVQSGDIEIARQYHLTDRVREAATEPVGAQSGDSEAIAAIPLSYGSRTYGVLLVNTAQSTAFDEGIRNELRLLGETAGFVINAVQNQQLLLSNQITELKFEVTDRNNLLVAVSDALDCQCRLEIAEPTDNGGVRCYINAYDSDIDDPLERVELIDTVASVDLRAGEGDRYLLEVVRADPLAQELARTGVNIREAVGENGVAEIVLEVPRSADINGIVDTYQSLYPDSELVAKRDRERTESAVSDVRETVEETLTDRQRTVLRHAYEAGYFEWPRDSTAEEVAEKIGVSSSTLHQHLRTAERLIFSAVFEGMDRQDGVKPS